MTEEQAQTIEEDEINELFIIWQRGELTTEKLVEGVQDALRHATTWDSLEGLTGRLTQLVTFLDDWMPNNKDEKIQRILFSAMVAMQYAERASTRFEAELAQFGEGLAHLLEVYLHDNPGNWKLALLEFCTTCACTPRQFPWQALAALRMNLTPELQKDAELFSHNDLIYAKQEGFEQGWREALAKQGVLQDDSVDDIELD